VIFLTVGVQLPFDRLVKTVDCWAGERGVRGVFAQVGESRYGTKHIEAAPFLSPRELRERTREAKAIVGHAGMGTILTSLELAKPLLVFPRRADYGEHRNDHQLGTARLFADRIQVALTEEDLWEQLDRLEHRIESQKIASVASDELLNRIRSYALGSEDR